MSVAWTPVPARRIHYIESPTHVPFGPWRSVDHSQHGFFTEAFFDEVAVAAGKDPYALRMALLADKPRHQAVLRLAAEREELRAERLDQLVNASPETVKQMGREAGADYMLIGSIKAQPDQADGIEVMFYQTDLQLIHTGWLYENCQGAVRELPLDAQPARHVYIKNHMLPLGPEPLHLTFEGAVEIVPVYFLPFQEIPVAAVLFKLRDGHDVVVLPIFFFGPPRAGSSRSCCGGPSTRRCPRCREHGSTRSTPCTSQRP